MKKQDPKTKHPETRHPDQPLEIDRSGTVRFKRNEIVRWLVERLPNTLNDVVRLTFTNEDRDQLMQLIGYSVCGYSDLDFVDTKRAEKMLERAKKLKDGGA